MFPIAASYLESRFNRPFTTPPAWVPTPANLRFRRAVRRLNEIVLALICERRREARDHGDLLSILLQARDEESGAMMSDEQLRSEALAFFLAGHETTATALTWTWYLLACNPTIQDQAREEAHAVLGDRTPTIADVAQLEQSRMAIEEAMRLYPPIWAVPRQAVRDDEIGGYRIPAGSTVGLCSFITHRHPDVLGESRTSSTRRGSLRSAWPFGPRGRISPSWAARTSASATSSPWWRCG